MRGGIPLKGFTLSAWPSVCDIPQPYPAAAEPLPGGLGCSVTASPRPLMDVSSLSEPPSGSRIAGSMSVAYPRRCGVALSARVLCHEHALQVTLGAEDWC